MIAAPVASRERGDELPADDERLLVGERQVDPLAERRDGRREPGRADDRVEDQVAAGLGDQPHQALRAREDLPVGPRLRRLRGGVGVGERDPPHAVCPACSSSASHLAALSPTTVSSPPARAADDVERLDADRAGRAEDDQPSWHGPILRKTAARGRLSQPVACPQRHQM